MRFLISESQLDWPDVDLVPLFLVTWILSTHTHSLFSPYQPSKPSSPFSHSTPFVPNNGSLFFFLSLSDLSYSMKNFSHFSSLTAVRFIKGEHQNNIVFFFLISTEKRRKKESPVWWWTFCVILFIYLVAMVMLLMVWRNSFVFFSSVGSFGNGGFCLFIGFLADFVWMKISFYAK